MTTNELKSDLAKHIDGQLASDLVHEFEALRNDCKTNTLGGAWAGKFVETVVQVLQYLEAGTYKHKPDVDAYLRTVESSVALNDDLRICCARVARACYTLRNKRSIAHKGSVDPNIYDLGYTFACAQWMLAELIRQVLTTDMAAAGKMIEYISIPISPLVEQFGDRKLVYGNFSADEELLVLLHSYYPERVSHQTIQDSLDRRAKSTISGSLKRLWKRKLVDQTDGMYKLTQAGYKEARNVLKNQ